MGGTQPPKMFPPPGAGGQSQGINPITPAAAAPGTMTSPQKTTTTLSNAPSLLYNPYTNVQRHAPTSGGIMNAQPLTGTSVRPPSVPKPMSSPRRALLGY